MKKELKESISNLLGEEVTGDQITGLDCLLDYINSLEERINVLEGKKETNRGLWEKLVKDSPMENLTAKKLGEKIEYPSMSKLTVKLQKASESLYNKAASKNEDMQKTEFKTIKNKIGAELYKPVNKDYKVEVKMPEDFEYSSGKNKYSNVIKVDNEEELSKTIDALISKAKGKELNIVTGKVNKDLESL